MPTTYKRLAFMSFRIGCFLKIDCPRWPVGLYNLKLLARRGWLARAKLRRMVAPLLVLTINHHSVGGGTRGRPDCVASLVGPAGRASSPFGGLFETELYFVPLLSHLNFENKSIFLTCFSFICPVHLRDEI